MRFLNVKYKNKFETFGLSYYLKLKGKVLSQDSISKVVITQIQDTRILIKKYYKPGKSWHRKLARYFKFLYSKGAAEFSNLLFFANNNFNTPEIIYFNEDKGQSCLVTKEVENSHDLFHYYSSKKPNRTTKANNFRHLYRFIEVIQKLHSLNFIHRDYKLKNVLLSESAELYLIDCPNGFTCLFELALTKYKLRDLTIIYKDLKKLLTKTQLLCLYKYYYGITGFKLDASHKANIKYIVNYYQ
jgi:tRNA A-37 threonylcarbamoyl transferase component Bud32